MKSTWFSNPKHYEFAKLLEASTLGRATVWDGFVSFLELSYLSLSQGSRRLVGMELGEGERRFEEVKSRVHSYEKMPEAMAVMVSSLEDDRYDFLGSVAAELGLLSKWGGQFFTPRSLCRVTALMVLGDDKPNIFNRLTVCEPACGAGAMVIELSSILRDRGFFPWHYWVDCTDVDTKMFWAAYIQLSLCGIPAVVRNADTLSLEKFAYDVTPVGRMYPYVRTKVEELPPRRVCPTLNMPPKRKCPTKGKG